MTDVSWVIKTSNELRGTFEQAFYIIVVVLLLLGVVIEYFKLPLGGLPSFAPLVGRVIVAFLLLSSYKEVSNAISNVSDHLAFDIKSSTSMLGGIETAWGKIQAMDWGWTSLGQTLIWLLGYLTYSVLYLSIFFFDAAMLYVWMICYVLSPLSIALFVLPQTAGATKALYRTLFEVASWKIIWSVMAALLWKSVLSQLNSKSGADPNFITTVAYMIMLSVSILATPFIAKALLGSGLSGITGMAMAGAAAIASGGMLTPSGLKSAGTRLTQKSVGLTKSGIRGAGGLTKKGFRSLSQKNTSIRPRAPNYPKEPKWFRQMNREIPPPHEPPGWLKKT